MNLPVRDVALCMYNTYEKEIITQQRVAERRGVSDGPVTGMKLIF